MLKAEKWRFRARRYKLEERAALFVAQVLLQDVPQPVDHPVAVMEPAVVMCVLPEKKPNLLIS